MVISDLHIGIEDNFDTFKWTDDDFIFYLENLIKDNSIDKVILNGDTFELYKYRYSEIYEVHKKLIDYFFDNDFVFVKGNHDWSIDFGLEFYEIVNSRGDIIRIEHGHNCDIFNGTYIGKKIGKFLLKIVKYLSNIDIINNLYFKIIAYDDQINRIPRKYNSIKYLEYALKLLKNCDVVILGHTHKIETHKTYYHNRKKLYLNSGSCSLNRLQAVFLDTETLRYDSFKYDENNFYKLLQIIA